MERRQRLDEARAAAGLDRLVIYGNAWSCDYLRHASGFGLLEGHGVAMLEGDRLTLLLESRAEAQRARSEQHDLQVVWLADFHASVCRHLHEQGGRTGYAPKAFMPSGIAGALLQGQDFTAEFNTLLMRKLPREIQAIRRAVDLADEGYEVFCHGARAGRTEYEVVADLEGFFRSRGCPDNFMIMASGGREVRAMHPPSQRRLMAGDFVTTELTPCVDGYYAQICRTLVIGPPSSEQQRAFDVHLEALHAGLAAVRPGVTAGDLARVQNDVFRSHGLAQYITSEYTRVRGHGLGLYVDSRPALIEGDQTMLEPDMTLIVHPNGYHPDSGSLVLGDMVRVRPGGCDVLTRTPQRLFSV